jgi:hypothetical protein
MVMILLALLVGVALERVVLLLKCFPSSLLLSFRSKALGNLV